MANNWDFTEANEADQNKTDTLTQMSRDIIAGVGDTITVNFASDANLTPTAATVIKALALNVTSGVSLTATRNLVLPLKKKSWVVRNNTTGGQSIQVIGATGTGITIPNGAVVEVVCDGTNFTLLRLGDPIYAHKTSDQTLIGSTFADVTQLGFAVVASGVYEFEFNLLIDADATTTGIDVACNGPASPNLIRYEQISWTSATVRSVVQATAYDNNTANASSQGTTAYLYTVRGILRNGLNAGTLIARAKREAVGSGPNVRAGSWGRLTRLQ